MAFSAVGAQRHKGRFKFSPAHDPLHRPPKIPRSAWVRGSHPSGNKGDFCLIGPFMSRITHAQVCCYSKFKMAARSGNFTSTLHADRYSLFMLVLANIFALRTQYITTINPRRIQAKKCVI